MSRETEEKTVEKLKALREAYSEQLPFRVQQIEALALDVRREGASQQSLRSLKLAIRSLAGSSKALGLLGFTDAARDFELFLASHVSDSHLDSTEIEELLASHVWTLKKACMEITRRELTDTADPRGDDLGPQRASRVLYFLSANDAVARDLSFEVSCFGFALRRFQEPAKLHRALEQAVPAAVMIDAQPFAWGLEEVRRIDELRRRWELSPALLLLSSRSDLESRIEAVRAGGDGYYVHPLETRKLIERLDRSARHSGSDPYRVLIVHGEYGSGLGHALTLQRAGMSTVMVGEPAEVWKELVEFRPEAILIDLTPREAGGDLIGAVIRQQDAYVNIPIVFLSTDTSLEAQLRALHAEADDLLLEPVDENYLVSTLSHHVQRARALKGFVATDGLTGLLTHSEFVRRMEVEVDRALRTSGNLSYAILDIDHLNSINETFGHLSGDSVLTNLARLLVRRLRRADLVGRWGGDELVVVMPETDGSSALRVLGHVREMFAGIQHRSADEEFSPTFSCGLVALDQASTAESLHKAARRMLAAARVQGRNRVVLGTG
ncbi:MAG: diguanylate cyclase [Acidobacteriota bacterium]|nr:diguanylate cyclase [Acidobacteriota bacterium]MDH3522513.1 diguanylate cyclase [Acidobacteriota bacterium]